VIGIVMTKSLIKVKLSEDNMTARENSHDVSWVFVSQIITLATDFQLRVILGRFLGAALLGLFAMTLSIYAIASLKLIQ
jgi:O-antigen/teichoic acid export membrane protein